MVENHVLAIRNTSGILVLGANGSHTETHVADNDIVGSRERHAVAIDGNTLAGCRLSGHIEVLGKRHARIDADDTCHIEHHNTVRLADSIAQRSRARVFQVSYMVDFTRTSARGKASPALCAREG